MICAGNRAGKSSAGVAEDVWQVLGTHPYRKVRVPNKLWICGTDYNHGVNAVLIPKFKSLMPKDSVRKIIKNQMGIEARWELKNGSVVEFKYFEQDSSKFESDDIDACIAKGEKVLVEDGRWVCIEDIEEGTHLPCFSDSGHRMIRKVLKKHYNGKKEVIKITTRNRYSIRCTKDHLLWSSDRNGWVRAGELKVGEKLYRPNVESLGTRRDLSIEDAFVLGAYLGDGWTNKSVYIASASCLLNEEIERNLRDGYYLKHKSRYDYRITNGTGKNYYKDFVKEMGLLFKKSHEKFVPDKIFQQEDDIRISFLRGIFATDGWVSQNQGIIGYASTSKKLSEGVRLLLDSLGIKAGMYLKKSQKKGVWRDQWFIVLSQASEIVCFCEKVGIPSKEVQVKKALEIKRETVIKRRAAISGNMGIDCKEEVNPKSRNNLILSTCPGYLIVL